MLSWQLSSLWGSLQLVATVRRLHCTMATRQRTCGGTVAWSLSSPQAVAPHSPRTSAQLVENLQFAAPPAAMAKSPAAEGRSGCGLTLHAATLPAALLYMTQIAATGAQLLLCACSSLPNSSRHPQAQPQLCHIPCGPWVQSLFSDMIHQPPVGSCWMDALLGCCCPMLGPDSAETRRCTWLSQLLRPGLA
jgi:hypothetical protein